MRTPKKTHTVGISWELFQKVKNKAIEKETSIQKIVEDSISDEFSTEEESPSKEKVYACPECGKEFETKEQIRGHMLHHDNLVGLTNEDIEELEKELDNV